MWEMRILLDQLTYVTLETLGKGVGLIKGHSWRSEAWRSHCVQNNVLGRLVKSEVQEEGRNRETN